MEIVSVVESMRSLYKQLFKDDEGSDDDEQQV